MNIFGGMKILNIFFFRGGGHQKLNYFWGSFLYGQSSSYKIGFQIFFWGMPGIPDICFLSKQ